MRLFPRFDEHTLRLPIASADHHTARHSLPDGHRRTNAGHNAGPHRSRPAGDEPGDSQKAHEIRFGRFRIRAVLLWLQIYTDGVDYGI